MIREPTLFVIGAGASKELNFPLGEELLGLLANLFNVERDAIARWKGSKEFVQLAYVSGKRTGTDPNLILEKARFIRSKILGTPKSIDQLIDTYAGDQLFEKVAKLGIAKVIATTEAGRLPRLQENYHMRDQPWKRGNWLHTFCRHYFAGFRSVNLEHLFSDVSFVCFNYDRCLEYALMRAAAHHFNLPDEQALELPNRIKIVHPYGSLGPLPQSRAELNSVFDNAQRDENVTSMSNNIRTFTEGTDNEAIQQKISEFVSVARKVVCLGFGYNTMNVGLLRNPDDGGINQIYGTTFGMKNPNAVAAQNQFCQQLRSRNSYQRFEPLLASDFLDQFELEIFQ